MLDVDVVVVGAGLAGSVAALRCAETGRRVVLLDAADDASTGGNTTLSLGAVHFRRLSLESEPDVLRAHIMRAPMGVIREHLADALVENAGLALKWLREKGVAFQAEAPGDVRDVFEPMRDLGDIHDWKDRGPQRVLRTLQDLLARAGGLVRTGARAVELTTDEAGAVTGVRLADDERIGSQAVVLADGGFQSNVELRKRFIGPATDRVFLRAARRGNGDCLMMAERIGAQLSNTDWFYGHCMHLDVLTNDRLWPWPSLDELLLEGGILVDCDGRRLTDEGLGGIHIANVIARIDDPQSTFVVVDAEIWDEAGHLVWGHLASNPELVTRGGRMFVGDPGTLAAEAGIDKDGLFDTLDHYNRAVSGGAASQMKIPRSGKAVTLEGTLHAFPMVPGISFTLGGVVVDAGGHVLDLRDEPIRGLYAAGATSVAPHGGYVGGLATALVQGMIAGRSAGADISNG